LEPESSFIGLSIVEKLCFKQIIDLVSGLSYAFARTSDEEIYCWGCNKFGQLGNGSQNDSYCELELNEYLSHKHIVDIKCGAFHSLALARSVKYTPGVSMKAVKLQIRAFKIN
jgi:alpha-tubulin suppressor-like RCC1 family protein